MAITIKRKKNSIIYPYGSDGRNITIIRNDNNLYNCNYNYYYYSDKLESLKFSPLGVNGNLQSFIDIENYKEVKKSLSEFSGCDTFFTYISDFNNSNNSNNSSSNNILLGNILREEYMDVAINKKNIAVFQYVNTTNTNNANTNNNDNGNSVERGYIRLTFFSGESMILASGISPMEAKSIQEKLL